MSCPLRASFVIENAPGIYLNGYFSFPCPKEEVIFLDSSLREPRGVPGGKSHESVVALLTPQEFFTLKLGHTYPLTLCQSSCWSVSTCLWLQQLLHKVIWSQLWFSQSACLSGFQDAGLSCHLSSLMDWRKAVDLLFVQFSFFLLLWG